MGKKISVNVALALTLIAITVTFAITWMVANNSFSNTVNALNEKQAMYNKLSDIDKYVRGNYYGTIDETQLGDRLGRGYLEGSGDRFGVYYSAEEYAEKQAFDKGDLVDVGIEILKDNVGFKIVKVYDDSPAFQAGVTENGYIMKVGDVDTSTVNTEGNLRTLLRGQPGTTLEMQCLYDVTEERAFSIPRKNYVAKTVESEIRDSYMYVRIFQFAPNTLTEFESVIAEATAESVQGLVFDVRNNAGGQYKYAYEIIDMLCPLGTIARSENKAGVVKVLATSNEEQVGLPMVALVNENTAGVAELFAWCVRDLSGGQIVGTKTAGRGTIQSDPQLMSDGSAVSVTIARLLPGEGESFDGVGLEPDVEVLPGSEELNLYVPDVEKDVQISRAFDALRVLAGSGQSRNRQDAAGSSAAAPPASQGGGTSGG